MEGVILLVIPLVALTVLLLVTHYLVYAFEWVVERAKEAIAEVV